MLATLFEDRPINIIMAFNIVCFLKLKKKTIKITYLKFLIYIWTQEK